MLRALLCFGCLGAEPPLPRESGQAQPNLSRLDTDGHPQVSGEGPANHPCLSMAERRLPLLQHANLQPRLRWKSYAIHVDLYSEKASIRKSDWRVLPGRCHDYPHTMERCRTGVLGFRTNPDYQVPCVSDSRGPIMPFKKQKPRSQHNFDLIRREAAPK